MNKGKEKEKKLGAIMVYNTNMNLSEDLIKRLRESKDFEIFSDYAIKQASVLDSISTLGDLNANDISIEVKARARAVEILEAVFSPVIDFNEKKELTEEEIEEAESKYGF